MNGMTPEQQKELQAAQEAYAKATPEQRKAIQAAAMAQMTPEQRAQVEARVDTSSSHECRSPCHSPCHSPCQSIGCLRSARACGARLSASAACSRPS